ncbi:VOC family protein [Mucilaginibacter terrae]|uniref:PhnB protein n=1 Tax=Mucilaginibacter terrae TaxID=1955052 RepID=A0ABU3GTV9_9SPHI|nr:VOC family protein [Mucilaginibacter terrae]MDT3403218.1 PhnB protein [Mucilaginibacter terrae]
MKRLDAYLFFDGNCNEAMNFYKETFGGELFVMKVGESPAKDQFPESMADTVLHACLKVSDVMIMASDNCMGGDLPKGKDVSLSLSCESRAEVDQLFDKLSTGGQPMMPPKEEFWGDYFGSLTDKYGFNWMLAFPVAKP